MIDWRRWVGLVPAGLGFWILFLTCANSCPTEDQKFVLLTALPLIQLGGIILLFRI